MNGGLETARKYRGNYRDSKRPNIRYFTHASTILSFRAAPEDVTDLDKDTFSAFHPGSIFYIG